MKIDKEAFGAFFDGTPGKTWDDYAARLRNAAAGEVDDRGYSLADEYDGLAEGGPFGPAMPAAPADLRKAQAAARRRQKEAYSLLTMTMELKTQVEPREERLRSMEVTLSGQVRTRRPPRARGDAPRGTPSSGDGDCRGD